MKVTVNWLEALMVRGWKITYEPDFFVFFHPEVGTYHGSHKLYDFPPAVEAWIKDNVPMTVGPQPN